MAKHTKISYRRVCMIIDIMMLLVTVASFVYLATSSPKSHFDIDRAEYPIKGIDVSAHNGEIDFERVAADTVSFVIIKATEGTDFCDAQFLHNYLKAKEAGLKVGAYHFFRFDTPGDIQASHFISSVKGLHFDLPLAIDVEKWGNPVKYEREMVKANLRKMVDVIAEAGLPMMLYTNKHGYQSFVSKDFEDVQLWLCSLSGAPSNTKWTIWQHSHKSTVDGINGIVDVNTYNGKASDFEDWLVSYTVAEEDSDADTMQ